MTGSTQEKATPHCHLHSAHVLASSGLAAIAVELCRYYRSRAAVRTLLLLDLVLSYVGGAFFFWVHAIVRGERGPDIAHWQHWLLDSSIAFIGLLPPLAVLLPLSRAAAERVQHRLPVIPSALARTASLGVPFALVTAAGPIAHDVLVGENTPLANAVTQWLSNSPHSRPMPPEAPAGPTEGGGHLADIGVQVAFGVPVYTLLVTAAFVLICRRTCQHLGKRDDEVIDLRAAEQVGARHS